MIPPASTRARPAGFTLVEVMVGLAISVVVLTQLLVATFSLQRSFAAADYRMSMQNDQLRVLDYLSRDLHMASAVSVQGAGSAVTLTLPNTNAALNLNLGTLLNALVVSSGAPSNAAKVSYYLVGSLIIRDDGTQTVLANTVAGLAFTQQGSSMTVEILFAPPYSYSPPDAAKQNTRASSRVYLRNLITVS